MNNFVKGLLFGAGFGIGILAIALLIAFVLYISPIRFGEPDSSIVGTDALVIQDHRINFNEGKPIISGTLRNSTNTTLSKVIVEGSIFDEDQCFIDKADEYFESILPQDKIGFKISFYDWDRSTDNKKFDYKVRIKQGYDNE